MFFHFHAAVDCVTSVFVQLVSLLCGGGVILCQAAVDEALFLADAGVSLCLSSVRRPSVCVHVIVIEHMCAPQTHNYVTFAS